MSFHLRPSPKSTAHERAQIQISSYANDVLFNSIMPSAPLTAKLDFFTTLLNQDIEKDGVRCLEVIDCDDGDKVVAFAQWKCPVRKSKVAMEEDETEGVPGRKEPENSDNAIGFNGITTFPEGVNIQFLNAISTLSAEMLERWYNPEEMFYLTYMHVLPSHQRLGLGQMLMRDAIRDADAQEARCYLSASEAGRKLYVKFGFRDVERKVVDFRELGALGWRETVGMVREVGGV